jgi:hypothetical protein
MINIHFEGKFLKIILLLVFLLNKKNFVEGMEFERKI